MRHTIRFGALVVLVALLVPAVSGQTIADGDWTAVFVGPIGPRPKMVDKITFSVQSTPAGLRGTARAAGWPGILDVTDMKLDGNRLTFTGTGRRGWSVNGEKRCCPQLVFDGIIDGDTMKLTMIWRASDRPDLPGWAPLPMEAARSR